MPTTDCRFSVGIWIVAIAVLSHSLFVRAADPLFPYDQPPDKWQDGQQGSNQCKQWQPTSPNSQCQTLVVNSAADFCFFAPPEVGAIGDTERFEVAWCTKPGYGTRLIPSGTLKSAHFLKTPTFVQVTGTGDLTKVNISPGDEGGELDNHGADGRGNPIGGLVYTTAFSNNNTEQQVPEWHNFMAANEYCIRACIGGTPDQNAAMCQHIYDTMGCEWNDPGNYTDGFDNCDGDDPLPPGVYGDKTFHQGDPTTPPAHPPAAVAKCTQVPDPVSGNGQGSGSSASPASSSSTTPTTASTNSSSSSSTGYGPGGIPTVPSSTRKSNATGSTPGQTPGATTSKGTNAAISAKSSSITIVVIWVAVPIVILALFQTVL